MTYFIIVTTSMLAGIFVTLTGIYLQLDRIATALEKSTVIVNGENNE